MARYTRSELKARVAALGEWFHNIDLGQGVHTAPQHWLGDWPAIKWNAYIRYFIPEDLTDQSVLDIGCNGGFYCFEMARRGAARVLGLDSDEHYIAQARFAAEALELENRVEFRIHDVYQVHQLGEQFDYIIFMGVLYHLRYPLLALDRIAPLVRRMLIFQGMVRGAHGLYEPAQDYPFEENAVFADATFPAAYFIEHQYAGDPTNWWIPNESGAAAMLRSAGLQILHHPDYDTFLCGPGPRPWYLAGDPLESG